MARPSTVPKKRTDGPFRVLSLGGRVVGVPDQTLLADRIAPQVPQRMGILPPVGTWWELHLGSLDYLEAN